MWHLDGGANGNPILHCSLNCTDASIDPCSRTDISKGTVSAVRLPRLLPKEHGHEHEHEREHERKANTFQALPCPVHWRISTLSYRHLPRRWCCTTHLTHSSPNQTCPSQLTPPPARCHSVALRRNEQANLFDSSALSLRKRKTRFSIKHVRPRGAVR